MGIMVQSGSEGAFFGFWAKGLDYKGYRRAEDWCSWGQTRLWLAFLYKVFQPTNAYGPIPLMVHTPADATI